MQVSNSQCGLAAIALYLTLFSGHASAQTPPKPFVLSVDNIMRANELIGYTPQGVYWSPDSKFIYFEWKKATDERQKPYDHYVVAADGTGLRLLTDAEVKTLTPPGTATSPDKRQLVYSRAGDLFLYDRDTGQSRQLTATDDFEGNPRFSADGKTIYFSRGDNAYSLSLADSSLRQLTSIRAGNPPPEAAVAAAAAKTKEATSQDELKKTQVELFETVRDAVKRREDDAAKAKLETHRKPLYIPDGQSVWGVNVSPDGLYAAVIVHENGSAARAPRTVVPRYVTESGYTEAGPGRSLVGEPQGRSKVALVNVMTGDATWIDFIAPEIHAVGVKAGPRQLSWGDWQWSADGKHAAVVARANDNKDEWIFGIDPATGKSIPIAHMHDDAWLGGAASGGIGFLADNRRVFFTSEQDGFAHLYEAPVDGSSAPTQVTQGRFETHNVTLSSDKTHFYFAADMQSPAVWDLYSLPVAGGTAPVRLTRISGGEEDGFTVSPDDKSIAIVRSQSNRPPELFITPNRPHSDAVPPGVASTAEIQVTHSPTAEWLSYPWIEPPIVQYPARDGKSVAARLYKPKKWKRGGPMVVFVHGAGYLQNVDSWWSYYFREYMFDHLLMERGYLVMDIDYRGSAGYGRDWRTAIYRHMGGKDLDDVVDGVRWAVATHGVDPKRVGIYGGSYGGFLTLMALFTAPDTFAAGAALRPVTDWQHYNHGYTADILNEPQNDPESYRVSSPILFANGLKGALLICHGMVDSNVHFQDSVRLAQRLIELHKENWELAPYPVEDHGFTEPSSWADEYKRILKLFDENLGRK